MSNGLEMLYYYFKIAWRNIRKNKVSTAINILGLTMGISACLVIYLIANYDLSFDRFHPGKEPFFGR